MSDQEANDNFVDLTINWAMDLSEGFLNNWDRSAEWSSDNPMPAFLITMSPDDSEDIQSISPDAPYFLDFEDGSLNELKYSKKDWGFIIGNVLRERKPISYLVICETSYHYVDLKTDTKITNNGLAILMVTIEKFAKVFLGDITRSEDGTLSLTRSSDQILEGAMMSSFFESLIHYDLGVSPILQ